MTTSCLGGDIKMSSASTGVHTAIVFVNELWWVVYNSVSDSLSD